jgi:hypothetical protein
LQASKLTIPKVARPALKNVVARPRLFGQLDRMSRRHPVLWVSAPAGSGKTTLAASYLAERRRRCLWFQFDLRDADPAAFFFYLREALRQLAPRRGRELPLLTPEYAFGLAAYALQFFEQLGQALQPGAWLVLDDFQELPEGAPLQQLLPIVLAALPARVRVLVLSRSAPPAPFARLVTERAIGFVDAEELGLTAGETRKFARRFTGVPLDARAAAVLQATAGGWMAGTVLLLEAGRRRLPPLRGAENAEQQVLFDYFTVELFERAPPEVQHLLLSIALLPEVDVPTAKELAQEPRAGEILADLVRRNFFTLRLAGPSPRYRLHPLFREFLRARAARFLEPAAWRTLAGRTAELLAAGGSAAAAAAVLVEADLPELLADLVRQSAAGLVARGQLASVDGWLRALPPLMLDRDPWLSYWAGVCGVASPGEARTHFARANRAFVAAGDLTGRLLSWAGYVATFFYVWDEFGALDPWIADMERLDAQGLAFPSIEIEAQVSFGMLAALMWRSPAHPDLGRWVARATALLEADVRAELRVQLAAYLSFYWTSWRGDLGRCDEVLEKLRVMVEAPNVTPLTQAFWCAFEAHQRARRGDHQGCVAAAEAGLEIVRRTGLYVLHGLLATQGIYGGLVSGDLAAARRYWALAQEHGGLVGKANSIHHAQLGAWISICEGDFTRAEAACRAALAIGTEHGIEIGVAWCELTLAHVHIERGEHGEAVRLLEHCIQAWASRVQDRAVLHHAHLSVAYARLVEGRQVEALPSLSEGLRIGREEGYLAPAWIGWRKEVMARLVALALEHGVEPEHARELVRAGCLVQPEGGLGAGDWPWQLRVHAMGRFEVLRDDKLVEFGRKAPRKPMELLQLLVAHGRRGAPLERLSTELWPEADGDTAHHALETTLYRLRRLLVYPDAVVVRAGRAALNDRRVYVDAWAAETLAERAASQRSGGDLAGASASAAAAAHLYRGDLFEGEEHAGLERTRARLREKVNRLG